MANDIRFAVRMVARRPGVAALIVLTLALGIAAATAVFTIADAILWHPLPFRDADRLVALTSYDAARRVASRAVRIAALDAWRAKDSILEDVYAYGQDVFLLSGNGEAEEMTGGLVSSGLFSALGARPILGRDFTPGDFSRGAAPVVILSDPLWRHRFDAAADVVGRPLTMNAHRYTVVGVMPRGFTFPVDSDRLWVPLVEDPARPAGGNVVARLRPGVSIAQAQAVAEATTHDLADAQGPLPELRVGPFTRRTPQTTNALWMLMIGVGLLLLIAIGNASNVLLAEAVRRDSEMEIRSSLGASLGRLVRQVVTETLIVTMMAAALGAALAAATLRLVVAGMPWVLTYQSLRPIELDWRAMAFAAAIAVLAGLGSALAPLARTQRRLSSSMAKGAVRASHGRLRASLVMLQLAVTLALLVPAGLLANGFVRISRVDFGFATKNLLRVFVGLPEASFRDRPAMDRFLDDWRDRASRVPGVVAATVAEAVPPGLIESDSAPAETERGAVDTSPIAWGDADAAFFATLGIPVLQGRVFDGRERPDSPPTVVISQAAAQRLWPGLDPIGRRLRFPGLPWHTVIGVVGNVRNGDFDDAFGHDRAVYFARTQAKLTQRFQSLIVRVSRNPGRVGQSLRELTRAIDPDVPIIEIETAEEIVAGSFARARFVTFLMWAFAGSALLLALVGVYGAFGYAVRQRRGEIGVRLALGATPGDIVRMVVTEGARVIAIGMLVGLPMALALSHGLRAMLFDVSPVDPLTLVLVGSTLVAAALTASYVPARRASRIDPGDALRHE